MTAGQASAGRFAMVDRHLLIRLEHNQAHVLKDVTEAEWRALSVWANGELLRIEVESYRLLERLASMRPEAPVPVAQAVEAAALPVTVPVFPTVNPAASAKGGAVQRRAASKPRGAPKEEPPAAPVLSSEVPVTAAERLKRDIDLLRAEGCTVRALPVGEKDIFPRYRFGAPGRAAIEITQQDLKRRATQLRRVQEADHV